MANDDDEEEVVGRVYHRDDDLPAKIKYSKKTGVVKKEEWFFEGKQTRFYDRPAYITYWKETGNLFAEAWFHEKHTTSCRRAGGDLLLFHGQCQGRALV